MRISKKSILVTTALAAALSGALSSVAGASGSEGFSPGMSNDTQLYNAGKGVYADKFACGGCPLSGKPLDATLAKEVLRGNPKVTLSAAEQDAVITYLKRRFKI
jgi:hypothetical protein